MSRSFKRIRRSGYANSAAPLPHPSWNRQTAIRGEKPAITPVEFWNRLGL